MHASIKQQTIKCKEPVCDFHKLAPIVADSEDLYGILCGTEPADKDIIFVIAWLIIAISGGLAATGVGVVGQTIANGMIGAVSAGVDTYVSSDGKATASEYLTNIAVGGVLGAVSGRIGGSGAGNKHLSASASRALKRVGSAVSNVGKSGIKTAAKEVAKAGRYYYSQVAKQALQNAQKALALFLKRPFRTLHIVY